MLCWAWSGVSVYFTMKFTTVIKSLLKTLLNDHNRSLLFDRLTLFPDKLSAQRYTPLNSHRSAHSNESAKWLCKPWHRMPPIGPLAVQTHPIHPWAAVWITPKVVQYSSLRIADSVRHPLTPYQRARARTAATRENTPNCANFPSSSENLLVLPLQHTYTYSSRSMFAT